MSAHRGMNEPTEDQKAALIAAYQGALAVTVARPVIDRLARMKWVNQAMGWSHVWKGADFKTGLTFRSWLLALLDAGALFEEGADIDLLWNQWQTARA